MSSMPDGKAVLGLAVGAADQRRVMPAASGITENQDCLIVFLQDRTLKAR